MHPCIANTTTYFQNIAPDDLLQVIRCNCKLTSRNPCGSNLCSCRRNGLKCVPACGDCRGLSGNNGNEIDEPEDVQEEGTAVETDATNIEEDRNIFDVLLNFLFLFLVYSCIP